MNRIREGYCLVVNPFNALQVSRVALTPDAVDAVVFWSKNPRPLLPYLDELDDGGYRYYFQLTICDYPTQLEPHLPPIADRIKTAKDLAQRIGPRRVIWRYDPIILSNHTDLDFHRRKFALIASELEGSTTRVVVSLVDFYNKVERNLRALESQDWQFERTLGADDQIRCLLKAMHDEALAHGYEIQSCAEGVGMIDLGIARGKCVDDDLIRELWGIQVDSRKDPGQRGECGCVLSRDIGANNTCAHGCIYCYATASHRTAATRFKNHDPNCAALSGPVSPEALERLAAREGNQSQLRLF